jgi:hypothetical protein
MSAATNAGNRTRFAEMPGSERRRRVVGGLLRTRIAFCSFLACYQHRFMEWPQVAKMPW